MQRSEHVAEIGKRFVTLLEESVTPEQFQEIRTRNDTYPAGTCASHDFIDANEVMSDAFAEVVGRLANPADNADSALWSDAWNWAVEHYLSHSATATALEQAGYPELY